MWQNGHHIVTKKKQWVNHRVVSKSLMVTNFQHFVIQVKVSFFDVDNAFQPCEGLFSILVIFLLSSDMYTCCVSSYSVAKFSHSASILLLVRTIALCSKGATVKGRTFCKFSGGTIHDKGWTFLYLLFITSTKYLPPFSLLHFPIFPCTFSKSELVNKDPSW